MKKLITALLIFPFSTILIAQVDPVPIKKNSQYCAELKDGIVVVVTDHKEITTDIITDNGTVIQPNGNILQKDGVTRVLKEGECINTLGLIVGKDERDGDGK